jgi:hypothetical protein
MVFLPFTLLVAGYIALGVFEWLEPRPEGSEEARQMSDNNSTDGP